MVASLVWIMLPVKAVRVLGQPCRRLQKCRRLKGGEALAAMISQMDHLSEGENDEQAVPVIAACHRRAEKAIPATLCAFAACDVAGGGTFGG